MSTRCKCAVVADMEVSAGDVCRTLELLTARAVSNTLTLTVTVILSNKLRSACCTPSVQGPEDILEESRGCSAEKLLADQGVPGSVDRMDITKGSLDDISRPASSEIRRLSRDRPGSLEVLSPEVEKLLHRFLRASGDGES